ncbi:four helix bundle protein [Mesonia mobilis]|uniref:Four helix bundle protein n=1 Tax=Mesonia mobilis TaxID=369791 RepID=A0ABQ3BHP7_9FLAO|nr:four helix bundle protein [Mesonia mobilis]MBQ0738056.1 four helix bundle protein [Aquimarina celericrescens]GGZ45703.1 four helix bundle protein [Mesonia mobilis]|tara:strand:- start:731 stop:1099 length:369 start_codon:yes stop_codon:yes gene_type:complete
MKPIELEDRLIQFAIDTIIFCKTIEKSFAGDYLSKQLIRSASASALNYGEARSAESTRDFLHKMKICLKELRECLINLKIQKGAKLVSNVESIDKLLKENNELISIFVISVKTSTSKLNAKK